VHSSKKLSRSFIKFTEVGTGQSRNLQCGLSGINKFECHHGYKPDHVAGVPLWSKESTYIQLTCLPFR
jgi:hypothetical protein